jgi:hypothetical protein
MQNHVGNWGLKFLGSQVGFFMGSLEIGAGKTKNDPTSMTTKDLIIGMNLSSSQTNKIVHAWGLGHFGPHLPKHHMLTIYSNAKV